MAKDSHTKRTQRQMKRMAGNHDFFGMSVAELRRAHFGQETPLKRIRPPQPALGCGCVYCLHLERKDGDYCPWDCEWCIAMGAK